MVTKDFDLGKIHKRRNGGCYINISKNADIPFSDKQRLKIFREGKTLIIEGLY